MVSGHLSQKSNRWYLVLELRSENGKRTPKWISTGLKVKGNKKKAEELLYEKRMEFSLINAFSKNAKGIYFDEYMVSWLNSRQNEVAKSTFDSYTFIVRNNVVPYFREQRILLSDLKPIHIDTYYGSLLDKGLSANTVHRFHANIHRALEDAVFKEMIISNPARKVRLPKKVEYVTTPYTTNECKELLQVIKCEKLELLVRMAVMTGLRRSELLGLRWNAIDFDNNLIHVNHSVIRALVDGHQTSLGRDKLKRDASFRTLPLIDRLRDTLQAELHNRYHSNKVSPDNYIFVDEKGEVLKPTYVSEAFPKLLKRHNLRHIRFHDLRHSCANLLITSRIPLIEVQQWMGHSNISTTADMYGHLTYENKSNSAETIKKN